ncbi:sulfite exporter TauE/SafE family protein [Natronosalvus rutilus]|uniref:Probable membrane transporter protein n=1 Tax=Natronosalvus rutilus TaxID=2953753 RepID=A0A9E7SWM5_9EURY|nr:sulfite exporter TauE/SafE family protein [Natronosalvus rutilus]UTF55227.1 sulfite exporter TauE/SafE family protein [Natronosalvus rutilus]
MAVDWIVTGLTALVILLASIVHGIAGFGFAQLSMGLMPLFRSPSSASIIFTVTAIVSNGRVWWSVREAFDWRKWIVPIVGLTVGMPLGIYVFSRFSQSQMRLAIGGVLLVAVIVVAATQESETVDDWIEGAGYRPGVVVGATAGFLSGILGGAVAIPGPPMIVYGAFMAAGGFWSDEEMKAVFTAFFGSLMVYRLGSLGYAGDVTVPLLTEAAVALPMVFLGAWLGVKIFNRIPERIFGWVVLALLTANAFILLGTAVPEL